jgi:gamma-glutamylcyclotransferase (GGCT)/AIG2-like uncharacterized protein YtfP
MKVPNAMICDFFVYGTLKRGECRETMWPRKPRSIRVGFVRGWLFDLGPYPAMWCAVDEPVEQDGAEQDGAEQDGLACDWIQGELWSFDQDDVAATIEELDQIEDTNQPHTPNLYDQILVRVYDRPLGNDSQAKSELALAYQYSRLADVPPASRIFPASPDGIVAWYADRSH